MKKLFLVLVSIAWLACDDVAPATGVSPSIIDEETMRFSWVGDFANEPYACDSTHEYDAYRNTTSGAGYFCDGTAWRLIAQDGIDGTNGSNGTNGTNGVSITWLGSFDSDPASPQLNQAYFNTVTGNSYIYNGSAWVILVQGRYAKVIDANSNYIGYAQGANFAFTSKGYLLSFFLSLTSAGTIYYNSSNGSDNPLRYSGTNCSGTMYVKNEFGFEVLMGKLLYNKTKDQFYKRKSTAPSSTSYQSTYMEMSDTCSNTTGTASMYEYETISRTDAGLPATITAPFSMVFQ